MKVGVVAGVKKPFIVAAYVLSGRPRDDDTLRRVTAAVSHPESAVAGAPGCAADSWYHWCCRQRLARTRPSDMLRGLLQPHWKALRDPSRTRLPGFRGALHARLDRLGRVRDPERFRETRSFNGCLTTFTHQVRRNLRGEDSQKEGC